MERFLLQGIQELSAISRIRFWSQDLVKAMVEFDERGIKSALPIDDADRLELELSLVDSNYGPESLEAFEASL